MVAAPQHGKHLQQAQKAGTNVEDVFQSGSPFLIRKGATEVRQNQGVKDNP